MSDQLLWYRSRSYLEAVEAPTEKKGWFARHKTLIAGVSLLAIVAVATILAVGISRDGAQLADRTTTSEEDANLLAGQSDLGAQDSRVAIEPESECPPPAVTYSNEVGCWRSVDSSTGNTYPGDFAIPDSGAVYSISACEQLCTMAEDCVGYEYTWSMFMCKLHATPLASTNGASICTSHAKTVTFSECGNDGGGGGGPSIRTCDELGWTVRQVSVPATDPVCGSTPELDSCESTSYLVAREQCAAIGARLCTEHELRSDVTRGTGCGLDNSHVWADSSGSHGGDCPGAIAVPGSTKPNLQASMCLGVNGIAGVRCCADAKTGVPVQAFLGWTSTGPGTCRGNGGQELAAADQPSAATPNACRRACERDLPGCVAFEFTSSQGGSTGPRCALYTTKVVSTWSNGQGPDDTACYHRDATYQCSQSDGGAGSACDDNDSSTANDVCQADNTCAGTFEQGSGIVSGNGSPIPAPLRRRRAGAGAIAVHTVHKAHGIATVAAAHSNRSARSSESAVRTARMSGHPAASSPSAGSTGWAAAAAALVGVAGAVLATVTARERRQSVPARATTTIATSVACDANHQGERRMTVPLSI